MFVPEEFRAPDPRIGFALIGELRTGTLMTQAFDGAPEASHLPFMLDTDGCDPDTGAGAVLIGHVDRRNPQWRALATHPACRVAFLSPQAHVSPSWYGTSPRAPTWLYAAVQVVGRAALIDDADALRTMVERLSAELEPADSGWDPGQIVPYTERLMAHIVGFTITVDRMETQLRLGQANTPDDRRRVLAALDAGGEAARAVAGLIRRYVALGGLPPAEANVAQTGAPDRPGSPPLACQPA